MNNKKQENEKALQNDQDLSKEGRTTEEPSTETLPKEIGGRTQGLEPTRYDDWEFKGRCIDF